MDPGGLFTIHLHLEFFCFSLNSGGKVWDVMLFQKARIFNEPRPENRSIQPSFIPGGSEIMKSVWISQTTLYDFAWCYTDPHCFPWFEMTLAESSIISNTFSCLSSFLNITVSISSLLDLFKGALKVIVVVSFFCNSTCLALERPLGISVKRTVHLEIEGDLNSEVHHRADRQTP